MESTHSDETSMDLFHIMKSSNVPLGMFERVIGWLKRHEGMISSIGTSGLLCRKQFIESTNKKLYDGPASMMKPKVCKTVLSSGRTSNVVSYSMREMILKMVTNKTLFHPGNLLLDKKNIMLKYLMMDDLVMWIHVHGIKLQRSMNIHFLTIYLCPFATLLMDCQWTNMGNYS